MSREEHSADPRLALLEASCKLAELGLNRGTSGNASVRDGNHFLVTPSGMDIDTMTAQHMVKMAFDGTVVVDGAAASAKPSSEWRFHRDILQAKPNIGAVIHTHAIFATTLSCLRRDIPPFHYMIAVGGGDTIRCAPYALFGSQALSDSALMALQGRRACLLANHGMIALGEDLKQAMDVAVEVETLCEQYLRALQVGEPVLLNAQEMQQVFRQFKGYSKWAEHPT